MSHTLDVEAVAKLAKIKLRVNEKASLEQELTQILNMVNQLKQVNTQNILPMAHPLDIKQRLRADEVTETDESVKFQAIAPQVDQNLYLVPKVIDND